MKNNLVLIGMPSSGKTTIGKLISARLGYPFIDSDEEITKYVGRSIPDIINENGENFFRDCEEKVIKNIATKENVVISCGGGTILRENNMSALKANGIVFYIERKTELLLTEGRPLSKNLETLTEMKKSRLPLYLKYADHIVDNDSTLQKITEEIIDIYENRYN